jgi:uncharacterized paraquat-inducible protein A
LFFEPAIATSQQAVFAKNRTIMSIFPHPKRSNGMLKSVNKRALFQLVPVVVVMSLLAVSGCSKNAKPPGLLSQEEMVRTMTDMYLVEQKVSTVGVTRDSTVALMRYMTPIVFKDAATSDSVFRLSFDYYMEHPKIMEEIYNALIDSLNLREQKMISNELKK